MDVPEGIGYPPRSNEAARQAVTQVTGRAQPTATSQEAVPVASSETSGISSR